MAKKYNTYNKQDKAQDSEQKANAWSTMFDKLVAYAKVIEGTDWKMGWTSTKSTWQGLPQNISGRNYTGGNSFYLMMATMAQNHTVPIYATFNQLQKMNAHLMDERGRIPKEKWNEAVHVKKGEQAEIVVFNTPLYVNSERTKEKPLSAKEYDNLSKEEKEKYNQIWAHVPHVIFNIDQTNMKEVRPELYEKYVERMMPKQQQNFRQDTMGMYEEPAIDYILNNQTWRCPITFDKESKDAFYRQSTDTITLPMKQQFNIPYTEKELEKDIQKYVTPAMTMQVGITDFSDTDRQMLRVAENKDNKEYLDELRATIMLENTFGKQLGITRQDGQSINDYATQIFLATARDREKIIAIKDTEAKIIGGQDYYTTFLHEGAHSMHKELNIELNATGDKKGYAREEMRVESSTAMVAAALGYSNNMFINSAAYIRGWNGTADIREKTKAMQQLVSDINKTVTRMGEIIDDARRKVGQEPVFAHSINQERTTSGEHLQNADPKAAQTVDVPSVAVSQQPLTTNNSPQTTNNYPSLDDQSHMSVADPLSFRENPNTEKDQEQKKYHEHEGLLFEVKNDKLYYNGNLNLYVNYRTLTLPDNAVIDGSLRLNNSNIKELPDNLTVNRHLILTNTQVKELPRNLTVNGFIDLIATPIKQLPADLKVKGDIIMNDRTIKASPDNRTADGYIDLVKAGAPITQVLSQQPDSPTHPSIEQPSQQITEPSQAVPSPSSTNYNIHEEKPIDRVAEAPAQKKQEFSLWDKLSALLQ